MSIPPRAYPAVPVALLAGKPVLDTTDYVPQRDGRSRGWPMARRPAARCSSGTGERARGEGVQQRHLLAPFSLARPAGAADRSALPIAGDDPAAKAAVAGFLDAIGYDSVDAGPLGPGGHRLQFGTRAFVAPYGVARPAGTPAGVAAVRAALGA